MHDQNTDRSGDALQLAPGIDLSVSDMAADRNAAGGNGLAQAMEQTFQSLFGIELGMRDQTAGIVENAAEKTLALAAANPLNVGAEHDIRLPDLIGVFRFELLEAGFTQQL